MALVPAAPGPPSARTGGVLVSYGAAGALGDPLEREKLVERLREDREAHSRKQIWTKDPHGGPYRKVNANKGYDPLIQLPDGSDLPTELGYERVKTGPTSNFVGNHMTQGAIDLVQAQLEPPPPPPPLPPLLGDGSDAAPGSSRAGPRLLQTSAAVQAALPPPPRPLQRYRWVDEGAAVRVEVPVEQMQLGAGLACASVTCTLQADRLELLVTVASGGQDAGASAEGSSGGSSSGLAATTYRMLAHPLHAAVAPDRCRCYLKGLPALPACSISGSAAEGAAQAGEGGSGQGEEAAPATASSQPQEPRTISFALPPTATAIVVLLAKADREGEPWGQLQAPLPLASLPSASSKGAGSRQPDSQPDLAALRKAVRQQLSRGQPTTAEAAAPAATPAAAADGPVPEPRTPPAAGPEACERALLAAEALVLAGRHAEALAATAACLGSSPGSHLAVRLHALRGHCLAQLGSLKQATQAYGAAAELAAAAGMADQRCQLLLARASLLEQQEQLEAALADVEEAAALQTPAPPAALLAASRLRRAVRKEARRA